MKLLSVLLTLALVSVATATGMAGKRDDPDGKPGGGGSAVITSASDPQPSVNEDGKPGTGSV
ncbi:hypothetical protein C8J57DRAFT_1499387 [Mycena rebaudengoi]|nr:hypothetical protein C8J57DRAFT_1499387 [Mycena rebaudengoi]